MGDTNKRRPATCRNVEVGNHSIFFAQIVDDLILYPTQQEVDRRFRLPSLNNADGTNRLKVPLSEALVKSAYNPDVSYWDILKFGTTYCFRCGPDHTLGVQYRCEYCRTLSLCDNCIVNKQDSLGDEKTHIIQFTCPNCHAEQNCDLGRNDVHATYYAHEANNQKKYHDIGSHLPVEFGMISQRLRCSVNIHSAIEYNPNSSDPKSAFQKPSPDSQLYRISEGLLSGLYWVNEQNHKAWRCLEAPDWRASHLIRSTPGLVIDDFTTDVIISYKTETLAEADRLRIKFEQAGFSVFMIISEQNKQDTLWAIRFSEAIYRARNLIFLTSEMYFDSPCTQMEVREFLVVDKVRRDLTKSDKGCVYGIAIDAKEPSDSFYSEYNLDEQAEILNCIKAHDEITQIILRNDIPRQGLFWRNIKTVKPWDSDTDTCPTCNALVFFDDEIDHLCEQQRRDILTTSKIAYACRSNHRYCSACDTHAKEDGLRGGCTRCASAGKNRKGHRAPRDIYFSNVNPRPLYGIDCNPNDLNCLNCKTKIDFEKSEALLCDQGHRYCQVCACEHGSSAHGLCPECMNGPAERLVIGIPTSINLYFYGASIDLPMIAEHLSSNWCALCFAELNGSPIVKFQSQWRACGSCMTSIENKLNEPLCYSNESWSSLRAAFDVGMYAKKYEIPTCEICKQAGSFNNRVGFQSTKTLGPNHIWAACKSCLIDARELLEKNYLNH